MKLTKQKRSVAVPMLNTAAMIDVIMLLIIFFMCTASFRKPEKRFDTVLAKPASSVSEKVPVFDPIQISLENSPDGVLITCDGSPCSSFDQLGLLLKQRRSIADVKVVIKADAFVSFRYLADAADCCYSADLYKIAFSTEGAMR